MENKRNPKVSVIIPVYNGEKTLKQCLNSVLNQTHKNYELIVVDNNSTDKTKEIIKKFQKEDQRIIYLFEPRIGSGAARNTGEKKAKGEIILMTDSDCIVPKNWIKEMIKPIIKNKQIAVQGIKKPVIINYWAEHMQKEEKKCAAERIKDGKAGLLDTANFAIRKSVLKKVGYTNPNSSIVNDLELDVRLKIKGYKIYFKQFEVLHYHSDNAVKVFRKLFIRGFWNERIRKNFRKEIFHIQNITDHLNYFTSICMSLLVLRPDFRYDFITGIAWRLGLIYGWMKNEKIYKK